MEPMYYLGLDVHKQKISYCVKDSSGRIYAEGWMVARGPYRFVRHPMYAGFLLMISGTVINLGNISGLAALTLRVLGTWWKLRQEEALLKKHFPDTYADYKHTSQYLLTLKTDEIY